jgi:hypothetical protein
VYQRLRLLLEELYNFRRVLTFDHARLRQRRLSSRGSGTAWEAGADSSVGGATSSSATAVEGSPPSQDRSVDFLQKYTKLVVIQARLLHQVLLGKVQYLQAGPDYRHGRGTEDAGNVNQSTLSGHLLLRLYSRCLLYSNGSWRSALLRSYSHYLFNGGGCGSRALLTSRGLALQLR